MLRGFLECSRECMCFGNVPTLLKVACSIVSPSSKDPVSYKYLYWYGLCMVCIAGN